ncbi:MAG: substrate-binding domain-containing protein [Clostridium fessum]
MTRPMHDGLSKDDLTGIYDGSITNWKDVGGSDMPIVVVGREAGSGTRGAFEELLGLEDACKYANELDSTGAVMARLHPHRVPSDMYLWM